jgi:hypothetical protein
MTHAIIYFSCFGFGLSGVPPRMRELLFRATHERTRYALHFHASKPSKSFIIHPPWPCLLVKLKMRQVYGKGSDERPMGDRTP